MLKHIYKGIRAIPSPAHHHHNSIMQTTEGGINSAILRYDGAASDEPLTGPVIHPVSLREADLHVSRFVVSLLPSFN